MMTDISKTTQGPWIYPNEKGAINGVQAENAREPAQQRVIIIGAGERVWR